MNDRKRDVRIIVSMASLFSLADRRDARGERRVFAARVVHLSPHALTFATTITAKPGERVIAKVEAIGSFEGFVTRRLERGFIMSINASEEGRKKLADKIVWVEKRKNHDVPDQRGGERIIPGNPYSRMVFADGAIESCLVLDFSLSGAAVSADTVPAVGTVLAVGSVVGRVMRHFEGGFAVQFIERQERDIVEKLIINE